MRRSVWHGGIAALAIAGTATPASADDGRTVSLPSQPLASSLQAIAQRFGIELLFSQDMLAGRSAPAISGRFGAQRALDLALAGSNLTVRRTDTGSYVVVRIGTEPTEKPEAIPDILVVGRRTQNADIRRTESDIQPYRVVSRREIEDAHATTVEGLFRTQLTTNAQIATLSQQPAASSGEVRSQVNLRGLGPSETLVLIDGRRLPQLPGGGSIDFSQPDINALPTEAIDRVEVITSTAGGIYGPGATGGVVNIVLRRDYRGADLTATHGVTDRGDAKFTRVAGRIGFTPDGGDTDVMMAASYATTGGLRFADRNFSEQARARQLANNPAGLTFPYSSPSINISSFAGPLVLKPAYGGATLNSALTFLPAGGSGSPAEIAAAAIANEGKLDTRLSPDDSGTRQSLLASQRTTSLLANIRHSFGKHVEAYVDVLRLDDRGITTFPQVPRGQTIFIAAEETNPFDNNIVVTAPLAPFNSTFRTQAIVQRITTGAIADLTQGWKLNLDYSFGYGKQRLTAKGTSLDLSGVLALIGYPDEGRPPINPFGAWSAYEAGLTAYIADTSRTYRLKNDFSDATVKVAGRVLSLRGGDLTATFQASNRTETVPAQTLTSNDGSSSRTERLPQYRQRARSLYGELRAPLADRSAFPMIRDLEVQLAVRRDTLRVALPENALFESSPDPKESRARYSATVYTAGGRVRPLPEVMVRASIATGVLPPTISQLTGSRMTYGPSLTTQDPRRGGEPVGTTVPYDVLYNGSVNVRPERARSLSIGTVLSPFGENAVRMTVDYTHIIKRGEIVDAFIGLESYFLDREEEYPNRIMRQALTPADIENGYTVGAVTRIDTTALNIGRTRIDVVDARIDIPIRVGPGTIRLHSAATWQPHFTRTGDRGELEDYTNTADGVLRWRANAGVEWSNDDFRFALNGQYYGEYLVRFVTPFSSDDAEANQGARTIPSQLFFDLAAAYRFKSGGSRRSERGVEVRFGVQNLFDRSPAIQISSDAGYSYYADPRRRRFELTVAAGL